MSNMCHPNRVLPGTNPNLTEYDRYMINYRNGYHVFVTDNFQLSARAIDMVNETLDYLEAHPEKWDQRDYGNSMSETNCFFGMLIRLNEKNIKPENHLGYGFFTAMKLLGATLDHSDRFEYISMFRARPWEWDQFRPTIDELRERVSIGFHHDFRKPTHATPETTGAMHEPTNDGEAFNERIHDQS